jgi:hypothetical protein
MEKSLSIIQGLTATDQANPIRITDAGEVKTTSTITGGYVNVGGTVLIDPNEIVVRDQSIGNEPHINVPHYENKEMGTYQPLTYIDDHTYLVSGLTSTPRTSKLLVDQAKSFGSVYTSTYDASANPTNDIPFYIHQHITDWIDNYGARYDDIMITPFAINTLGTAKFFVTVTIIRYY